MSQKRGKSVEEENLSKTYVQFIDILFAVVTGQSFVLLSSGAWFATWLAQPLQNAFGIATLVLVYVLLITSWIGYHRSVQAFPIKSVWRFLIDIILLLVYYMGFVYASNFQSVTVIFALSFMLYAIWDALRVREYYCQKGERGKLLKRFGISVGFAVGFVIIALIYLPLTSMIQGVQWGFFVAIAVLLVVYRYLKWYRRPSQQALRQRPRHP